MSGVFISYRRDDSQGFAGRLADDLSDELGADRVFRDIEIPIGSDFGDVLHRAIAASDALLVVIGRDWAATSSQGQRSRLFEPTDWVRAEIESAFALEKQVVPVLVAGAPMPKTDDLPESITRLTRLQAAVMSDRHWDDEIKALAVRLRAICPSLVGQRAAPRRAESSLAEVLRELGERTLEEARSRRAPPPRRPGLLSGLWRGMWRGTLRGVRKALTGVLLVSLVYVGIRLFGDEPLLRQLDAVEDRLQIGWERLQGYLTRL